MKLKIILSLFAAFLISCNKNKITGTYEGFWAESLWNIELCSNNKFHYTSEGHAGDSKIVGDYILKNDTVILINTFDPTLSFDTLVLINMGDTCLVEISTKYDYCKNRQYPWASDKWDLETRTIVPFE